ncbi:hypothetical protein ACHAQA_002158 [Verticillium albo-atrum]
MSAPTGSDDWTRRDWFQWCSSNIDNPVCDGMPSYYEYRLSIGANGAMLGLFSLSALLYITTYAVTRRGLSFFIAMILGVLCEVLGYAGRVMGWQNQWSETGFLMQICCLTIGPAFLAAGIYLCLRRIVYAFGPQNSRIRPEWYTRIFIPCDIISLVLQALGGAMASIASTNDSGSEAGDNIMIAGLVFQVVTMLVFMIVTADFARNTWSRQRRLGTAEAFDQNPTIAEVRSSRYFRAFLAALTLSFICIFIRCVFRVAELSGGWTGPLMGHQNLFIGFESAMIATAVLLLNVFHPALACKPLLEGVGGLNIRKGRKGAAKNADDAAAAVELGRQRPAKSEVSSTSDGA